MKHSDRKNILVTGGKGFIGSHLCKRLRADGHTVTSLDWDTATIPERLTADIEYITCATEEIADFCAGRTFDAIYHLGEYSRVENSFDNIEEVIASNIRGTAAVFEFWRAQKCKLIYAGSSTKFATDLTIAEISPYMSTKATNTRLVASYGAWFDLPYAICYFYNAYGPSENETGTYATLIGIYKRAMREGNILSIVLPGTQKRNFTHIDDIVDGLICVGIHGEGDDFGIGSDESYSIEEIADMFGGVKEYLPARKGNRLSAEVRTAKTKALGWKTQKTIKEYIDGLRDQNYTDEII